MIFTLDFVVLRYAEETGYEVLLLRRAKDPYAGAWALPGGWIFEDKDEDLDDAYQRIIANKVRHPTAHVEQVHTDGSAKRDPRGWSTTTYYMTFLEDPDVALDEDMMWVRTASPDLEHLPFDHHKLITKTLERLASKAQYSTLPMFALGKRFTLSGLEKAYEAVLGGSVNTSAFRKRIEKTQSIIPTDDYDRVPGRRPGRFYERKEGAEPEFYERLLNPVG